MNAKCTLHIYTIKTGSMSILACLDIRIIIKFGRADLRNTVAQRTTCQIATYDLAPAIPAINLQSLAVSRHNTIANSPETFPP